MFTNKSFLLGFLIIAIFVFFGIFGNIIAPYSPYSQNLNEILVFPNYKHWFGTDELGRDIFSRILVGSKITLFIVFIVSCFTTLIGLFIGIISGYIGGWVDTFLMRLTDIFLALPKLILALALVVALGPGLLNTTIALTLTSWPSYARLIRAETLKIKQQDYIKAAYLQGANNFRVIFKHILPMCFPIIFTRTALELSGIILSSAGLGFLGLGIQPPLPEWGSMLSAGRNYMLNYWWVITFPGLAIFIVSIGSNLLGDGLRDILDKREN